MFNVQVFNVRPSINNQTNKQLNNNNLEKRESIIPLCEMFNVLCLVLDLQ